MAKCENHSSWGRGDAVAEWYKALLSEKQWSKTKRSQVHSPQARPGQSLKVEQFQLDIPKAFSSFLKICPSPNGIASYIASVTWRIVTHCYAFRETDNGRPTPDRNETNYSKNVAGKKTTPEQIFGKVIVAGFCLGTEWLSQMETGSVNRCFW